MPRVVISSSFLSLGGELCNGYFVKDALLGRLHSDDVLRCKIWYCDGPRWIRRVARIVRKVSVNGERIYMRLNGQTPRKEGIGCRAGCLRAGVHDRLRDKAIRERRRT